MLPDEVLGEMNRGRDNGNTNENNNDSSSNNDNNNNNQVGEGVNNRRSVAKDFADVAVIFCMISDFDKLASGLSPELLVTVLNIIYTNFDTLIESHNVYKVETVGEVYLVAAGLPTTSNMHATSFF